MDGPCRSGLGREQYRPASADFRGQGRSYTSRLGIFIFVYHLIDLLTADSARSTILVNILMSLLNPLFNLLLSKQSTDKAVDLVNRFAAACPPPDRSTRPLAARQIDQALEQLYAEAGEFAQVQKLGIFRKAAFGRSIQNGLLQQGYPLDMVTKVTSALLAKSFIKVAETAETPDVRKTRRS